MKTEKEDYGIDLKRFTNHKKVFPWKFLIKVIIGLAMVAAVYYFTNELVNKQKSAQKEQVPDGIEVEIATD